MRFSSLGPTQRRLLVCGLCVALAGCGDQRFQVIYPANVRFTGARIRGQDLYIAVFWDGSQPNSPQECPFTIEGDGKVWTADRLERKAFLKSGASAGVNECIYRVGPRDFYIDCAYDPRTKKLARVAVFADGEAKRPVRIALGGATINLPATANELAKLGKPESTRTHYAGDWK